MNVPKEEQVAIYRNLFPEIYQGLGEPYLNPINNEYTSAQYEDHIINPKYTAIMSEYFDQTKYSHGLEGAMLIPARVDKECRKKVRDVLKGVKDQIHDLIEASDNRQTKKTEDITISYSLIDLEEPNRV